MAVKEAGEQDLEIKSCRPLDGASRTRLSNDPHQPAGDSGKVVWVIVALALIFIATISYFVAQMPRRP
jgi:hypothetical protein